ncbi:MAG: hypothetical protein HC902_01200 [Calothrix sp. SM1_5_4]|nr:hypothetical protein [Calothrix sp. SM1_5_4]
MRSLFTLTVLFFATSAYAQWGTGAHGGTQCIGGYGPSQAAYNGRDEVANFNGRMANANSRLQMYKERSARIKSRLNEAKSRMRRVLTTRRSQSSRSTGFMNARRGATRPSAWARPPAREAARLT